MPDASIDEIFLSVQGEGPWIGRRQIFIRFTGCDIRCRYCDTPSAVLAGTSASGQGACRAQLSPDSFAFEQIPGKISGDRLTELCSRLRTPGPARPVISLTGGEPLLHDSFLAEWLPTVKQDYGIYLETNGLQDAALTRVKSLIDVISMDFKLPSATGLRAFWEEHKRFLAAARGTQVFVKAVITSDTSEQDVLLSAALISEYDAAVPLVLQPAAGKFAPESGFLMKIQSAALAVISDVRIIPQAHKMLQIP